MDSLKIKELINQLIDSPYSEVSSLGIKLSNLHALFESKQLSISEYFEILADLEHLSNITDQMREVEHWSEISKAIDTIDKIRNWLPLI